MQVIETRQVQGVSFDSGTMPRLAGQGLTLNSAVNVPTIAVIGPLGAHVLDVAQWRELRTASSSCREVCLSTLASMRHVAPRAELCVVATGDGGMTLELGSGDREVAFAIPEDGSVRYFVARGPGGFRRAGLVAQAEGVGNLGRWLGGRSRALALDGLEVA